MFFDHINGNSELAHRLENAISSGKISHAYIFDGGKDTDKISFAKSFIKCILCNHTDMDQALICRKIDNDNHEDVHYVFKDGVSVKEEQIESLQDALMKKPFGERNIAVIADAETMTDYAQNRLLKTLEEPFPGTVMILLVDNAENLLPTIRSRCVMHRLENISYVDEKAVHAARELEELIYSDEYFYILKAKADAISKDRDFAYRVLECLEECYEQYLLKNDVRYSTEKISMAIEAIEEAKRKIQRKMNVSYAMKAMILKIGG